MCSKKRKISNFFVFKYVITEKEKEKEKEREKEKEKETKGKEKEIGRHLMARQIGISSIHMSMWLSMERNIGRVFTHIPKPIGIKEELMGVEAPKVMVKERD